MYNLAFGTGLAASRAIELTTSGRQSGNFAEAQLGECRGGHPRARDDFKIPSVAVEDLQCDRCRHVSYRCSCRQLRSRERAPVLAFCFGCENAGLRASLAQPCHILARWRYRPEEPLAGGSRSAVGFFDPNCSAQSDSDDRPPLLQLPSFALKALVRLCGCCWTLHCTALLICP